jgi:hypothetical protein
LRIDDDNPIVGETTRSPRHKLDRARFNSLRLQPTSVALRIVWPPSASGMVIFGRPADQQSARAPSSVGGRRD